MFEPANDVSEVDVSDSLFDGLGKLLKGVSL